MATPLSYIACWHRLLHSQAVPATSFWPAAHPSQLRCLAAGPALLGGRVGFTQAPLWVLATSCPLSLEQRQELLASDHTSFSNAFRHGTSGSFGPFTDPTLTCLTHPRVHTRPGRDALACSDEDIRLRDGPATAENPKAHALTLRHSRTADTSLSPFQVWRPGTESGQWGRSLRGSGPAYWTLFLHS